MNGHSKIIYLVITFLFLVALGLFFFTHNPLYKNFPEVPYKVITPSNYATGTTVTLYKSPAPDFPKEFIMTGVTPNYSGTVTSPIGSHKTTVTYESTKSIVELSQFFVNSIVGAKWNVVSKISSDKIGLIQLKQGTQSMVITIAPRSGVNMITLQYEY